MDPSKLFVAQNTLDTRELFARYDDLSKESRTKVRRRLNLDDDHSILVFVGQLVKRKGTRELLEVFRRIQSDMPASLLVIGDGPDKQAMMDIVTEAGQENVHFLGSLPLIDDSAPYIFASDVTVIPGYVGLVATHSLGLGV
ncbi:MAG: glycosyltransferase, partial [Rhodothermales bacterium]|nr:glycosyltransferase [Rhodothermales bacterium]